MQSTPSATNPSGISERSLIVGIDQPVIERYFSTLNAGEFGATGHLFAQDGVLKPPFDPPCVGAAAIAAYLQAEARGFHLQPHQGTAEPLADGCTGYQVIGKVQTPLFTVNVAWQFVLNQEQKLVLAKIKLLASLQELTNYRHKNGMADG
jgi:hypothetical protein